ncbi:MAG: hypothetical protein WCD47_10535 [Candidatus Sulfotelmatobacter sp.]
MINKVTKSLLVLAAGGLMLVGAASAQTQDNNTSGAGPGVVDPGHPRVNEVNTREQNQQDRIANGVQNGTMDAWTGIARGKPGAGYREPAKGRHGRS